MILVDSKTDWVRDPSDRLASLADVPSTGVFFFTLALFGFSCLSSLGLFANERILFMRERCDPVFVTPLRPTLTELNNKIKRILFFLYLLHIEGAWEFFLWTHLR